MTAEVRPQSLPDAVAHAVRAATRSGEPRWVALRQRVAVRDPLAVFDGARPGERFYWERPDADWSFAAVGATHVIECRGPARFEAAARAARRVFAALHAAGEPGPRRGGALLVGGFAFADDASEAPPWRGFPPGRLVLPELIFERRGETAHCTALQRIEPGADVERETTALRERVRSFCAEPGRALAGARIALGAAHAPRYAIAADRSHADYCARVDAALRDIAAGDLEKVVLARSVRLRHDSPLEPAALIDALRGSYPACATFAVGRDDGVFLGATPERLVCLEDGRVATAAVAGSAPRGRNPEHDAHLGRELCESKKEQAEHAVVVRALRAALAGRCHDLDVPEAPRLLRLDEVQHLETPITGTLRNGESILELVASLHPTPAVGGAPRDAALAWIASGEDLDRGWYAGPVGFVDADGGGEFCVALRSTLLRDREAHLFAGAGIVDGSIPAAELRETRLKLRAVLAPLLEI